MSRAGAVSMVLAALAGLGVASIVRSFGPPAHASVPEGTEEAFATGGLHEREIPPGRGPQRWMGGAASFLFEDLPPGPAFVEVRLRGHEGPVRVEVNGVLRGEVQPAGPRGRFEIAEGPQDGRLLVSLSTRPFERGGRDLGALVGSVRALPVARGGGWRLALRLALAAALVTAAALAAGLAPAQALGAGAAAVVLAGLGLWPNGLQHSPYAARLPWLVAGVGAMAALIARAITVGRGRAAARPVFVALAAAFLFHAVAATSPMMVVSDAVFHAHVLRDVAAGEWHPTSVTQHAQPFRIPYGSAFYALLVPFYRAGLDPVALVRWGAGLAGCAASFALLALLLPLGAGRAALGVLLWLAMPVNFDVYSAGNLSNAFGQWASLGFLAWWTGAAPLGAGLGALLLGLSGVSHLSSFLVMLAVLAGLVLVRRGRIGRARALAVALGLGLAAVFYGHYAGLVLEQLPRLLEGGGQGRGAAVGFAGALSQLLAATLREWGVPVLLLAAAAPWRGASGEVERDMRVYGLCCLALALPALLSPLAVRYVLALCPALALLAADGALRLGATGRAGRLAAALLILAQAALAADNVAEAILQRYR